MGPKAFQRRMPSGNEFPFLGVHFRNSFFGVNMRIVVLSSFFGYMTPFGRDARKHAKMEPKNENSGENCDFEENTLFL